MEGHRVQDPLSHPKATLHTSLRELHGGTCQRIKVVKGKLMHEIYDSEAIGEFLPSWVFSRSQKAVALRQQFVNWDWPQT